MSQTLPVANPPDRRDRAAPLRADWRQEWEAELRCREAMLAEWDKLDWRNKFDLLRRSLGALLALRCCYNHEDWRTRCFKTCVSACECC